MKEWFTGTIQPELGAWLIEKITGIVPFNIEYGYNLAEACEHMKYGGLITYFLPHTTIWDPTLITQRILHPFLMAKKGMMKWAASAKFSPEIIKQFGLPWSMLRAKAATLYAQSFGFENIPFIQSYLFDEFHKFFEGKSKEIGVINFRSFRHLYKHVSQSHPGAIVAISPEGTRNDNGGLLRAHDGLGTLLEVPHTKALPIVLCGAHRIQSPSQSGFDDVNPFVPVTAHIGRPLNFAQAYHIAERHRWTDPNKTFTISDALMLHAIEQCGLEVINPTVDPRGAYACENIRSCSV